MSLVARRYSTTLYMFLVSKSCELQGAFVNSTGFIKYFIPTGPKLSSLYNVEALNDSLVVITWGPASLDGVNEEIKELSVYQIVWCNGTFQDKCLVRLQFSLEHIQFIIFF